jgi:hypothetical protein
MFGAETSVASGLKKWVSLIPVESKQVVFIIRVSVVQPPQYLKLLEIEILTDHIGSSRS